MRYSFFFTLCLVSLWANIRLDYYYDQSEMYTKFSDWIPKRLHQWEPKHVEDFFLLYSLRQHYGEEELRRNIFFLKIALTRRFRHPSQALTKITTPEEYHKYRLLIFMHLHLSIMRSYLRLASLYDKRHLYFYNLDFAEELKNSFAIAEGFYKEALPYWEKAKSLAQEASRYSFELDLGTLESIRHDIMTGEIDFSLFTQNHLDRLKAKQEAVADYLQRRTSP
ncbi:MAG: hypothetical protein NZM25_11455 [Leptospiraceae bacterium]|nr:hypothetical protein [Leptospiraceae bacterium]MDW8307446.1 hypothetical protein [Leptospiraceae bacterium]